MRMDAVKAGYYETLYVKHRAHPDPHDRGTLQRQAAEYTAGRLFVVTKAANEAVADQDDLPF